MVSFVGRVMNYLVNQIIVDGLANSRAFQRFAVRTSKTIDDVSAKALKKRQELMDQMKDISKNFDSSKNQ